MVFKFFILAFITLKLKFSLVENDLSKNHRFFVLVGRFIKIKIVQKIYHFYECIF